MSDKEYLTCTLHRQDYKEGSMCICCYNELNKQNEQLEKEKAEMVEAVKKRCDECDWFFSCRDTSDARKSLCPLFKFGMFKEEALKDNT